MEIFSIYLFLFSIIVLLGQLSKNLTIPIALILVIAGMLLSFVPYFPEIHLNPNLVLNIFLPLLIYQISAFSSWRDMKKQARPIALLSIGHVVFITCLVAIVIHTLIPNIGWPIAFMLGAIISPPDDVAIISIAEKIHIPERIFIILEGEGMFNDAAALTIFRFALVAALTNQFYFGHALLDFSLMIIGETIYGLILGYIIGELRIHISNTALHLMTSFITPFIAYIPMIKCGSSGIIATAIVGFIIGNQYTLRFTSEYRLSSLTIWPTLAFSIQSIIFLLVGLDMRSTILRMSTIPIKSLLIYAISVIAVVIVGRFIWVYGIVIFLPRFLFPSLKKRDPYPSWGYPFIISWAGIRGGISLAAALAIPALTLNIEGVAIRDLLVFIVFSVILFTLIIQGLSLPFIIKKLGVSNVSVSERYTEHMNELQIRTQMINAALQWLKKYKETVKDNKKLLSEVLLRIHEYQILKKQFASRILSHKDQENHDEIAEMKENMCLLLELINIEKAELIKLWREDKINLKTRNKLLSLLDHQAQRHTI